ncbi:purine nucleoside phosphorylase [Luteitalea sp. TBR-22]|uniref:purine-nucleoside phosphorylase n=1 Tax=Luteitalea sp. TBR-22 TaxID=2802971 RepID=UPI001AF31F09|nr:purine-nucleoside phosphorylase [Luteitalea sp. TBR-22]BCS34481.1 purine nucleoside phosphorylase [Luteitalea sp. TBR-22]
MSDLLSSLDNAVSVLRQRAGAAPDVAVVLGSGLGAFAETLADATVLPYAAIPEWPSSAVVGHAGKLVVGTHASGARVAALSGRAHLYEGHHVSRAVFGVRAMARWGVPRILLTNAAGGINTAFTQGALMLIEDHINLLGANPLVGPNVDALGVRFPDMTYVYDRELRAMAVEAAAAVGVPLQQGVYLATMGPSYETPAEIRAFRALGADAVGMSTVPEAIAARHMGARVAGISCITNPAAGVVDQPLQHDEVMETAARVRGQFIALLDAFIARMVKA